MLLSNRFALCRVTACALLGSLMLVPAGPASAAGLTPAAALARFQVPAGFRLQLFASEPEIRQPVSMTFDARGRMWVVQYLQYPNPAGLTAVKVDQYLRTKYDQVPEPPPRGPRGADRITIIEDTDGDGHADSYKDFVDGLNLATGVAIGHGGAFVAQAPYLLFYADRNGDDVPDGDPEVLLSGFGLEDAHALLNSLQWGPDGWLYGAQGSTVTANIRGITFQQGIWRYHPITKKFELFAEGGGNTWGADFDRHGNMIAGTNWGERAMLHQVQGAYYVKGFAKHGELQNPHAYGYFEHVPYSGFKGGHVTCGGIVYQGGAFPAQFQDQYIAANVLANGVYWHHIERSKSSFVNRFGGELITTDDSSFRPVDCTVGPDGSLFVADWYDKRANHVDPKDDWDRSNGRIYKLVADGTKPVTHLNLAKLATNELMTLLTDRNEWMAREARLLLAERRDTSVLPKLREAATQQDDPRRALESLWALYQCGGFDDELAGELLQHADEDVRTWTVRLLGDERQVSPAIATRLLALAAQEPSPVVRSQLACTARRLPAAQGLPLTAALLQHSEDVEDPHIPLLLWWSVEDKASTDREQVLTLLGGRDAWDVPLTKEVILPRLARRYAAIGGDEDFAACARLLAAAPSRDAVDALIAGMEKGLEGRRLATVPMALQPAVRDLQLPSETNPSRLRFAVRVGSDEALTRAIALVVDRQVPVANRVALIEVLGQAGDPRSVDPLLRSLDKSEPSEIQLAALAALTRYGEARIAEQVLAKLPRFESGPRTRAIALLCSRATSAAQLLAAVDRGEMKPTDLSTAQLKQIALFKDPPIPELLTRHWGKVAEETPAEKRARVHGINVSLNLTKGDAGRGRPLFAKHCGTCHTLFGEGNKIGPDLTGAERKNREFLLTSIVDPSAVIRKEFFNYVVTTKDGRVLTGLLAENTPQAVTVLDAKNVRTIVAREDVDTVEPAAQSLMPEKILDELDADQVRDLMTYLQSDAPASPSTSGS